MFELNWVKGDLIELAKQGRFDAVGHGCNCFHTMGSGIAPLMNKLSGGTLLEADKTTPFGDINKLGTVSFARVRYGSFDGFDLEIYNLYTQYIYGSRPNGEVYVHWESFEQALDTMIQIAHDFGSTRTRIGIPLIGCGLAGGRKNEFEICVGEIAWKYEDQDIELTIVEFE